MGVHFINEQLVGPVLDPMKPQILLYEPDAGGKLRLTGAEWFVPLAIAKERPKLFNQDFVGPMEGHEPVMPAEVEHYDLHVWLFKENPEGISTGNLCLPCDRRGGGTLRRSRASTSPHHVGIVTGVE
jgi:hypothetical protein